MPVLLTKLMAAGSGAGLAEALGADVADSKTATGTNQATAFETSTAIVRFTTVAAGTGALLDNGARGDSQFIVNAGANDLAVYPHIGGKINGLTTNAAYTLAAGSWASFDRITDSQWQGRSDSAANLSFTPSGTGAVTRDLQTIERAVARTGDFDTSANYLTRLAALTETFGVARLNVQQSNGVRYQTSTGYGPFASHTLQTTFNGTVDNVLMLGAYNITEGTPGTKIVASEPTLFLSMEADYNNGVAHLMEMNMDYTSPSGGVNARRFLAFNVDRATDLGAWGFNCDTLTFKDSTSVNAWFNAVITATTARISTTDGTTFAIGGTAVASRALNLASTSSLTGTQQFAAVAAVTISSAATVAAAAFTAGMSTQAAAFTCADFINFYSQNCGKGAGSAITNQYGFFTTDLTSGGSNYGYYGAVSSGANKYNLYMTGTAQNYLAGVTGIGVVPSSSTNLVVAAGTTGVSPLRIPHGAAPTAPVDGDTWTTTSGLFIRINGVTKTVTLT